jgi:hypothetical protein
MTIFMIGFRQYLMIGQLKYQALPVRHLRYPIGLQQELLCHRRRTNFIYTCEYRLQGFAFKQLPSGVTVRLSGDLCPCSNSSDIGSSDPGQADLHVRSGTAADQGHQELEVHVTYRIPVNQIRGIFVGR